MEGKQEVLNIFLSSSKQVFAILDEDGRFIFFNDATPKILNYSSEDLNGKVIFDLVCELDSERTRDAFKAALNGEPQLIENRFGREGSGEIWVSWNLFAQGNKLYATAYDITKMHNERDTLRIAQNRLRLLHQATADPTQGLNEKVERVLNLGNLQLGTKIAIVSRIKGDTLTIFRKKSDGIELHQGRQYHLRQTFDSIPLQSGSLIGIQNVKHSVYDEHPAHIVMKFETYLAVPLYIDEKILAFSHFQVMNRVPKHLK